MENNTMVWEKDLDQYGARLRVEFQVKTADEIDCTFNLGIPATKDSSGFLKIDLRYRGSNVLFGENLRGSWGTREKDSGVHLKKKEENIEYRVSSKYLTVQRVESEPEEDLAFLIRATQEAKDIAANIAAKLGRNRETCSNLCSLVRSIPNPLETK